jgi:hypothetical protein
MRAIDRLPSRGNSGNTPSSFCAQEVRISARQRIAATFRLANARVQKSARRVETGTIARYLFLAFSLGQTIRILHAVSGSDVEPALFFCLGLITLSVGRMWGIHHPYFAPEFAIILFAVAKTSFMYWLKTTFLALDEFLLCFDRSYGYAELFVGRLFYQARACAWIFRSLYFALFFTIPLMYLLMPTVFVRSILRSGPLRYANLAHLVMIFCLIR